MGQSLTEGMSSYTSFEQNKGELVYYLLPAFSSLSLRSQNVKSFAYCKYSNTFLSLDPTTSNRVGIIANLRKRKNSHRFSRIGVLRERDNYYKSISNGAKKDDVEDAITRRNLFPYYTNFPPKPLRKHPLPTNTTLKEIDRWNDHYEDRNIG